MPKRKRKRRSGLVYLDRDKLERLMRRQGLTRTGLAERAGLSRNTIIGALADNGVFPASARLIAEALDIDDLEQLMPSSAQGEATETANADRDTSEWDLDQYLGPWITASNGLQFRICRMKHRFIEGRLGRGKWYDLLDPSTAARDNLRTQLVRHATICERIGRHPRIVENVSTYPGSGGDSWWVVDRWFDSITLEQRLKSGAIPRDELPRLMLELAQGLEALHVAKVVFRELAPSRILLSAADGGAVLSDFELAKLQTVSPTVSTFWPDDPYRALEVDEDDAGPRSDLYSWARILVHASTGCLPPKGQDFDAITQSGLPKPVWRIATDCLSPSPSGRPRSMTPVIKVLRQWARA